MIKDYRIYCFTRKEAVRCFFEGMLLNGVIAILFFNSLFAMIPGMIIVLLYFKVKKRKMIKYGCIV